MTVAQKSNTKGALLALAAFGLFATHDVAVKILGAHYATFQIIFFSVLLSFPLVVLLLMRDTHRATLIPVHPWWTALRTGAAICTGVAAFFAFSVLPLAEVYTILFAMPLIITVLSIPILGERVGRHRWAAVVVGLIGVIVVLQPGATAFSAGHGAALLAAFSGAFASIIVRKIGKDERDAVLMLYPMMANFVLMAVAMPFVYQPMPLEHLGLVAMMAAFAVAASLALIAAYKAADAALVAPMQYSQIIWAAVYGLAIFDERAEIWTWIGAGIVIASGVYIVLRESFGGTTEARPVLRGRGRPETATAPRPLAIDARSTPQDPLAKQGPKG